MLLSKYLGPCNAEPHQQPHCCCMNIDYTNCQMCLGYSRHTNMGLGPCNADINPHAQPLSCCMHMMSHGLRCLCQGPGAFKQQFSHLHQVISSVSVQNSVHSPVQSPGFTPTPSKSCSGTCPGVPSPGPTQNSGKGPGVSLVPRPSPAPVFGNWSRGRPGNEATWCHFANFLASFPGRRREGGGAQRRISRSFL